MNFSKEIILLADIVNYSLKGVTAALGRGTGFSKHITPLSLRVESHATVNSFAGGIVLSNLLKTGDIVVIPSKVIALLEKRFVYGLTQENYERCTNDLKFARDTLRTSDNTILTYRDLIGLDKIDLSNKIGIAYPKDPNLSAYQLAKKIKKKAGIKVDVVITDSDSGGRKGTLLIGCPTIITTPIGATKGLRLFYCMRVAVAAELTWNNMENMPILLVQPSSSSSKLKRHNIGEFRYKGFLDAQKEQDVVSILE